jgi:hypothetical protein
MTNYLSRLAARTDGRSPDYAMAPIVNSRNDEISRGNEDPLVAIDQPVLEEPSSQPSQDSPGRLSHEQKVTHTPSPAYPTTHRYSVIDPERSTSSTSAEQREPFTNVPHNISGIRRQETDSSRTKMIRGQETVPDVANLRNRETQGSLGKADQFHSLREAADSLEGSRQVSPGITLIDNLRREPAKSSLTIRESSTAGKTGVRRFHLDQVSPGTAQFEPSNMEQKWTRDNSGPSMTELLPRESASLPAISSPVQQPKLTIGRLVVEVIPTEPSAVPPQPRHVMTQTTKPQGNSGFGTHSKLRFGLGQI